jgi:diaminohydroxyphosphoribosylaminopyrimidine deaminase/5-amino-6-(5-phosphoribosylamino)uracil reductase
VLDSKLRTPLDARLLRRGPRIIIACAESAPKSREKALAAAGAEVWRLPAHRNGRLDLHPLGRRLADLEIQSVLVEGGGEVHAYLLDKRLCDELVLYVAPKVVGGPAKSWVGGDGRASMASAIKLVYEQPPVVLPGGDMRIHATLAPIPVPAHVPDDD